MSDRKCSWFGREWLFTHKNWERWRGKISRCCLAAPGQHGGWTCHTFRVYDLLLCPGNILLSTPHLFPCTACSLPSPCDCLIHLRTPAGLFFTITSSTTKDRLQTRWSIIGLWICSQSFLASLRTWRTVAPAVISVRLFNSSQDAAPSSFSCTILRSRFLFSSSSFPWVPTLLMLERSRSNI